MRAGQVTQLQRSSEASGAFEHPGRDYLGIPLPLQCPRGQGARALLDELEGAGGIEAGMDALQEIPGVVDGGDVPVRSRVRQRLDLHPGPFLLDLLREAVQRVGRPQALDQHDGARQLGEDARPLSDDLAPEAVPDHDRPLEAAVGEHRMQVGDVVGHRVDARMGAVAVPAQVVGDHAVVGRERLSHRSEGEGEVLDAVGEEDRRPASVAPLVDLEFGAARFDAAPGSAPPSRASVGTPGTD